MTHPSDGARVAQAIRFLDEHAQDQPELAEVAAAVQLSEYHFQRLFRRWAGVSPKRFVQFLTAEHARAVLAGSRSVLDAALATGLSGPGRLHDLTVNVHAMSPGEVGRRGEGLVIRYGYHGSPFGECLLGATERGICALGFVPDGDREATLADLRARWPRAGWRHDDATTGPLADRVFWGAPGRGDPALALHVHGTNFQIRVWEALLRVPEGALVTYGDLARAIGDPKASRAVGTAVGANPISYLIPCHRVIRATGVVGRYRWGTTTKKALIGWESAHREAQQAAVP